MIAIRDRVFDELIAAAGEQRVVLDSLNQGYPDTSDNHSEDMGALVDWLREHIASYDVLSSDAVVEESGDRDDLRFEGDMIRWVMNDVEAHRNRYAFGPNDSDAWKAAAMHIRSVLEWRKRHTPPADLDRRLNEVAESNAMLHERLSELEAEVLAPVSDLYRQDTPSHEERLTTLECAIESRSDAMDTVLESIASRLSALEAQVATVDLETRDATVTIAHTRDTLIGDLGDRLESLEARAAPVEVTAAMIDAATNRLKVSLSSWPETHLRELVISVLQAALCVAGEGQ